MKEIKLAKGLITYVDDEDYEYLNQFKWSAQKHHNTYYVKRAIPNPNGKGQIWIKMHREIMQTPKDLEVDHIDNNGLNNQKHNLRNCTHAENGRNRLPNKNNPLGLKGVRMVGSGRFIARIRINQKDLYLGTFDTPELAGQAYNQASKIYHKEFAKPNLNIMEIK